MILSAQKVASGTYAELWWDGDLIAECHAFESKYSKTKEDVAMCGQFISDSKMTGAKGTGSLSLYKVYRRWKEYAHGVLAGRDVRPTLIGKVADPDSPDSATRVALYNVSFDEVPLVSFEAGKIIDEQVPFTFTAHKFLD